MPVSGNEETGFRPISRPSSGYIAGVAGVPIKKRRFPLYNPYSSPSEDSSNSLNKEQSDSLKKEQSDSLKEQSDSLRMEQSNSLKSEQSDSPKKDLSDSVQKEQSISLKKGQCGLPQKDRSDSVQEEQSDLVQKEQFSLSQGLAISSVRSSPGLALSNTGLAMSSVSSSQGLANVSNASVATSMGLAMSTVSSSQGLAMSNASVVTNYSGISDTNNTPGSEESRGGSGVTNVSVAQSNSYYPEVKLEEPSLSIHSGSLDEIACKDKLVAAEKSTCLMTLGNAKLQLAPSEAHVHKMGKGIHGKEVIEGKPKAAIPTAPGNTELTLGLKEHHFPALADQNTEGRGQDEGRLDSGSLKLSLSKEYRDIQGKSNEFELRNDAQLCVNRANWDLNTTMDAWESSTSDATVSGDGFNTTDYTQDIKPIVCSTGMIKTVAASKPLSLDLRKDGANPTLLSKPSFQQYKLDNLHLGLSPSFQPWMSQGHSTLSGKEDSGRVVSSSCFSTQVAASTSNPNGDSYRTVKLEPFDDNSKLCDSGTKSNNMELLDNQTLKHDLVGQCSLNNSLNTTTLKLVDGASIKCETADDGCQVALSTVDGTSQEANEPMLQDSNNYSLAVRVPGTAQISCPVGEPSCSRDVTIASEVANQEEPSNNTNGGCSNGEEVPQKACESESALPVALETSLSHDGKELSTSATMETVRNGDGSASDPEQCRLKSMNEVFPKSHGSEGSGSDEEKINISADMLEEDSYSSDYESDGNHPSAGAMGIKDDGEEDDYEDGEVREPLGHDAGGEPICEKQEIEHGDQGESDNRTTDIVGHPCESHPSSSNAEEKQTKTQVPDETNNEETKDCFDTLKGDSYDHADKGTCLQESVAVEKLACGAEMKKPIGDIQRTALDGSGNIDCLKEQEKELSSERNTEGNQEAIATVIQAAGESVNKTDLVENNHTSLSDMDISPIGDDATREVNSGGNRSRIITLSRASYVSSPGKTSSISPRSLPSQAGRERLPDVPLEVDKMHSRGRDEWYIEGSHKFSRERHQDQSSRNSRLKFLHGRGRIPSQLDTLHGDWDSDRNFNSEFYNGPTAFRVPRNKYASAVTGADLEYDCCDMAPDGPFFGAGQGGREHLNGEGPMYRHMPPRRRSPVGRDGPAARGVQMIRRVPRNVSPGRCVDEDGSEVVGLRHGEKFMRVFPDDPIEPMFRHTQPAYEGVGGHFSRGTRNFSSVQRRGLPRVHSKSPIRSRSRSPVPWPPSPRRRSQDGFGGHPELTHRRSSPIYRMERIRSPDRPCFTGELMVRRPGSPPYLSRSSNDLRDLDSGRDHGHPRSVIPNRSPSGRILLRNRRFDVIDPRERTDGNQYFGGPMNTGRLHELGGNANGDERRRFGERRGPVRSFRPPYNDANGEGFHLNSENGPRPFRFCAEDDSEFHQRGNLRDRDFDRRIKNRSGNAPRRERSIEGQDPNYRNSGQVWHDNGFDEMSRVKRKRF